MSLSAFQRKHVTRLLTAYCDHKVHLDVRHQLRLGFRVGESDIVLYEERPRSQRSTDWIEEPVAKFRYVASQREWRLYCQHRDLEWHEYQGLGGAPDFDSLLVEVEDDPTGIFWG